MSAIAVAEVRSQPRVLLLPTYVHFTNELSWKLLSISIDARPCFTYFMCMNFSSDLVAYILSSFQSTNEEIEAQKGSVTT